MNLSQKKDLASNKLLINVIISIHFIHIHFHISIKEGEDLKSDSINNYAQEYIVDKSINLNLLGVNSFININSFIWNRTTTLFFSLHSSFLFF